MTLPVVNQADVRDKRVLVRGDLDIPLGKTKDNGYEITDDTRLKIIKPTLDYLLQNGAQVILCGHLGRPSGQVMPELSTKPIQEWASESVGQQVRVLGNLRFDPREEANDESYARELAAMADVYINEAFAASERAHASIVGVPKFLPHYAGYRLAKEVEVLSKVLENPARPLVVIIGGAKIETKQPLIDKISDLADEVIVGGRLLENHELRIKNYAKVKFLELTSDRKDVDLNSLFIIHNSILSARTIVWNGPLGQIEEEAYQTGTKKLAELILVNQAAHKVVGGGDTVAYLNKLGLASKFDWVSTGGGSMLKFLAGEKLPGLEALLF